MTLLERAIAAHGGIDRWRELRRIRLRLRCGGLAMAFKGRPGILRDLEVTVDPHRPRVDFAGLGSFDGRDGRPRGIARRVRWTNDDVVHFAGYALWNYLSMPFALTSAGVQVEEVGTSRLRAVFPGDFPTHSRTQTFHLDDAARVERVDYTAEVFGPWARAANRCLAYDAVGGLVFATRRRVVPRGLPGPTLVSIAIDDLAVD